MVVQSDTKLMAHNQSNNLDSEELDGRPMFINKYFDGGILRIIYFFFAQGSEQTYNIYCNMSAIICGGYKGHSITQFISWKERLEGVSQSLLGEDGNMYLLSANSGPLNLMPELSALVLAVGKAWVGMCTKSIISSYSSDLPILERSNSGLQDFCARLFILISCIL